MKNPGKNATIARATLDAPEAPAVAYKSDGQRLICAIVGSQSEVAARCGVSKASVGFWRAGSSVPGPSARAKLARAFGIPESAWDTAPGGAAATVDPPPSTRADPWSIRCQPVVDPRSSRCGPVAD